MTAPLPPPPCHLAEIAGIVGAEATLRLVEEHGGCRIWLPKLATPRTRLARDIGLEAAARLSAELGAGMLDVPLARQWLIAVYRARGDSVPTIARRLRCTEKAVRDEAREARAKAAKAARHTKVRVGREAAPNHR